MKGQTVVLCLLIALGSIVTANAEGSGWVLNLERSTLIETATSQPLTAKAQLMLVTTGVAPKGREGQLALNGDELSYNAELRFSAKLDGRDYPIHGSNLGDSIAIDVAGDESVRSIIKSNGNKVVSFSRSFSSDAQTMVVTARYFGAEGQVAARERLIFERR
jgi:hypothetical protein